MNERMAAPATNDSDSEETVSPINVFFSIRKSFRSPCINNKDGFLSAMFQIETFFTFKRFIATQKKTIISGI